MGKHLMIAMLVVVAFGLSFITRPYPINGNKAIVANLKYEKNFIEKRFVEEADEGELSFAYDNPTRTFDANFKIHRGANKSVNKDILTAMKMFCYVLDGSNKANNAAIRHGLIKALDRFAKEAIESIQKQRKPPSIMLGGTDKQRI